MYIVNGDLAIGRIFIVEILDLNRSKPEFIGCHIYFTWFDVIIAINRQLRISAFEIWNLARDGIKY
jgi:hypothetical protein